MDLDFTKEQEMLIDSAAKFLANECPFSKVREIEESMAGYSSDLWYKMAELGWLGLIFPEEYGGFGGEFLELVLLTEEMGKQAFPSPFFSTVVQCGLAVLGGGSEEQKKELIPRIADGSLIMSLAQIEEEGNIKLDSIRMKAEKNEGGYILNGLKMFVSDANIAHILLTAAVIEGKGLTLFLVDSGSTGVEVEKLKGIAKDNICAVRFNNVRVAPDNILGAPGAGSNILAKVMGRSTVVKCAEMIGGAKTCIDMTANYAKEREQYGKPIGGYQAIQHYMANMLVGYDTVHEYLYRAACLVDMGLDVEFAASVLKAKTNENYKFISERAVQIHGAIGTTREYDISLFYRRAKAQESAMGDTELHLERIMALCEDEIPVT